MKLQGIGTRAQLVTLVALAVALALFLIRRSSGSARLTAVGAASSRAASADIAEPGAKPAAVWGAAQRARVREVSPEDVPILRIEDLAERKPAAAPAAGRDLFDFRPPTPVPTKPPPPAPTPVPVCGSPAYVGPARRPRPRRHRRLPTSRFRFIGSFGPKDNPIAVFVQGDQVVDARAGDVVFDRFRVVRVNYESVDIGFVPKSWTWKETRRLGIAQ